MLDEGGLPGAGVADNPQKLPPVDLHIHVLYRAAAEGRVFAVGVGQMLHTDDWFQSRFLRFSMLSGCPGFSEWPPRTPECSARPGARRSRPGAGRGAAPQCGARPGRWPANPPPGPGPPPARRPSPPGRCPSPPPGPPWRPRPCGG